MLMLRFALALVVVFCLAVPIAPQNSPRRDPQAMAVLTQAFSAMGGTHLSTVRDTQAVVEVTSYRGRGPEMRTATITTLGWQMWRSDSKGTNGNRTLASNGRIARQRIGGDAVQRIPLISIWNSGATHLPLVVVEEALKSTDVRLEYLGVEQVGMAAVHHVRMQRKFASDVGLGEFDAPCELYLDSQTFSVTKLTYPIRSAENLRRLERIEVRYSGYENVAGLWIPVEATYWLRGQKIFEQKIVNFAVNRGAKESDFEVAPQ